MLPEPISVTFICCLRLVGRRFGICPVAMEALEQLLDGE
jgi:hypothetical protein